MKLTEVLLKQHIGWHLKQLWKVKSRRQVILTKAEKVLKEKGFQIEDATEVVSLRKKPSEPFEVVGMYTKPLPLDKNHPNWKARPCLTYKDDNVLLEGLKQAQVLTNTVVVEENPPEQLVKLPELPKEINQLASRAILGSHVLDGEQVKLSKIIDPLRPAFGARRPYGISDQRANKLITLKLLNLVEKHSKHDLVKERYLLSDLYFSFPFEYFGDLIQFQLTGDAVLVGAKPLQPVFTASTEQFLKPDIFPVKPTVTLNLQNFYDLHNTYPISKDAKFSHPHTIFVHHNKTQVKNIYEEEVTEPQIFGRALLKAFTVAASYARQKFGNDVKDLPTPVTVQLVQTDGRLFHFGVFQLNTLDLEENRVKNVWFKTESIPLFTKCCYETGKPILQGYNSDVIKRLFAFYNSN